MNVLYIGDEYFIHDKNKCYNNKILYIKKIIKQLFKGIVSLLYCLNREWTIYYNSKNKRLLTRYDQIRIFII